jgi:hypothetical protein
MCFSLLAFCCPCDKNLTISRRVKKGYNHLRAALESTTDRTLGGDQMLKRAVAFAAMLGMGVVAFGQEAWDIAKTTINGKKVAIEYGRPLLKGRTLPELMKQLPPDRIWRAGAGPATILSSAANLLIGGKKVNAGNYSLYMYCPEKGEYALIVNSEIGQPPDESLPKADTNRTNRPYPAFMGYTQSIGSKEVARIPLKSISARKSEILTYQFEPAGKGAVLTICWGDQSWTTEFQPAE